MRYFFEDFALDTDRRELLRGSDLVRTAPQVFDLLDYLIRNRERVVSKDDLVSAIWNGRFTSDAALTTRLNAVRSAVGDTGDEQRLIKTFPRKGVRFVGTVREVPAPDSVVTNGPTDELKVALPLPDKPSIAVLPFQNLSGDVEQDYFCDGMVESIITGLSRTRSLFVISRHSSFTYKGKAVDIRQVGRELGVRYVLEGSIRKSENRVRIAAQLNDASSGINVWANSFDDNLDDIFDLQDRLTSAVIGAISPQLERAEIMRAQRKPTESLQAYDYYLRAIANLYRFSHEGSIEALRLTEIANGLDPKFAGAYALGSTCYVQARAFGWRIKTRTEEIAEAERLARRALELDKDDPSLLAFSGHALALVVGLVEEGAAHLSRAITIDPNLAVARIWRGWVHLFAGEIDAGIAQFHVALRLSPLDPRIFVVQNGLAYAHFFAGRDEEALMWATKAVQQQDYVSAQRIMMACLATLGRIAEARDIFARLEKVGAIPRISVIRVRSAFRRPADVQRLTQAFRMVGFPE
ncbi:adenylate cyclase 3 [Bradyrhizobium guangdongense]|uniref:winged helix-turn-helix domain-containing tetratricopeptide repeat protein n=1 Tax=Bradyrhizobium guangdongense TaxID=1325090 RepID=UPI0011261D70|nr:winged helix-turn-helix domain-containing protein [Bradyrhizobium guangdongense]TPQ39731.1 adenylate cyclase 3 [Bradyrhizobium guangdongense]